MICQLSHKIVILRVFDFMAFGTGFVVEKLQTAVTRFAQDDGFCLEYKSLPSSRSWRYNSPGPNKTVIRELVT